MTIYDSPSLRDRLFSRLVVDTGTGCLIWTGSRATNGYGAIMAGSQRGARVHRVMYELFVGPIPDGMELDHLCRVRHCAAPAHLEPVTHRENMRRALLTHCKRGHEFSASNTSISSVGRRVCRQCARERYARWRVRHSRVRPAA